MFNFDTKNSFHYALVILALSISLSALVASFSFHRSSQYAPSQRATITVSGTGKVSVKPDIATITFTAREVAPTVGEAQKKVDDKVKTLLAGLKDLSVADKDISTDYYSVNPKYTYNQIYCITVPCPTGKQTLEGYEVAQTVSVKIRALDKAGDALTLVGKANITEVSGPNFSVDALDQVRTTAKSHAVEDARTKASATASALGVHLGKIVSYSEDGGYVPMAYSAKASGMGMAAEDLSLPVGETTVNATVSITYEIEGRD